MKKIIIITTEKMPQNSAGAVRLESLGKIFLKLGYYVDFCSLGNTRINKDSFSYFPFGTKSTSIIKRGLKRLQFNLNLKRFLKNKKYDLCLYTEVKRSTQKIIKKYCLKNNVKVAYDCVEWFSPTEFKYGKYSLQYRINDRINRVFLNNQEYIISISSYLHTFFKGRKLQSILIPAILDSDDYKLKDFKNRERRTFLYAGSPGKKDQIDIIVKSFLLVGEKNFFDFQLNIVGCSFEDFIKNYPEFTKQDFNSTIVFHGRVSRAEVLDLYQNTDFSLLMRDNSQRFAQAGFPTKFAESMMNYTPVITNISSDLGKYLVDTKNGFVVTADDADSLKETILKALRIDNTQIKQMSIEARKTAEKWFDYRNYVNDVKEFMRI